MIIDLCCGLGRFPGQDVVSIDINPKVRPTIVADVRHLPLRRALKPALVHASPPCKYFSLARARRYGYDEQGIAESLRIVAACFEAFRWLEPRTWTLENPRGMLKRLLPSNIEIEYAAYDYKKKATNFWSNNRALKRSIIPQDVRQRILRVTT